MKTFYNLGPWPTFTLCWLSAQLSYLCSLERSIRIVLSFRNGHSVTTCIKYKRNFRHNFPSDWFEHRYDFLMATINIDTDGMPQARPFTPHFIWYPLFDAVLFRADLGLRCLFA